MFAVSALLTAVLPGGCGSGSSSSGDDDADNIETVVLPGVMFDLSAAVYENEFDQNISANMFYNSLGQRKFIKIKDTDSNGIFDKAELDD